jgi:uncharacterized protein (TIGR02646 family)
MRRYLVDALLAEQGHLCAYCNVRIGREPGRHHIEHLLPRRLIDPTVRLTTEESASIAQSGISRDRLGIDHRNLLACCPNKDGKDGKDGCGDKKGAQLLPMTPLEPRCEEVFRYLLTGTIEADLEQGRTAIRVLGLDRPELTRARREALEGWLQIADELTREQVQQLLEHESLPEFVIAARQLLHALVSHGVP